jgi:type I restriction-modification system DNA methylase subunit
LNPELLEIAHKKLYWPEPNQIFDPSGAGPSIYARLAQEKIGKTLERDFPDAKGLKVGVLSSKPLSDETEAPLAIVCAFERPITQDTLQRTHRLAWSFSRTQALVTIEPNLLRVWTCCEAPHQKDRLELIEPITKVSKDDILSIEKNISQEQQAAETLYWVEIVTGRFFEKHHERFDKNQAADQMLLNNLKSVRRQLSDLQLKEDIIHDLLARLIFIQFLFQRKDSAGKSALDKNFLQKLFIDKVFSAEYTCLSDILSCHKDTYAFFRLLNDKFNGDLFPGKGATDSERNQEWLTEEQSVSSQHLRLLADFVSGTLKMDNGQLCLWPLYSFDAVPLDFISSIYEEFVSDAETTGAHYTPGHIVDFILDNVLPWNDPNWNLKILDPSCGSGIFLVKAFQRIIHRWKCAHPEEEVKAKDLRSILENNIFGVDINQHAVRVASFSLYLTMCDEIDPKQYWNTVRFPKLRSQNLLNGDFFQEDIPGIRTDKDGGMYDLVIGNAPWGRNSAKPPAIKWAKENKWDITYGNVGPLFLPKAASLTKLNGQVAMMQPASILLFSQHENANMFRKKLFTKYRINEVVNLSSLRFGLFENSISPSCIITLSVINNDDNTFNYICPKPALSNEDDYRIIIEPNDINEINVQEVIKEPVLWTALMWGNKRDAILIRRLNHFQNLRELKNNGVLKTRQGIIRTDRKKRQESIIGKRILDAKKFPPDTFLFLKAENLPINNDPMTHSRDSTDYSAFELPQLILKQSFQQDTKRFEARLIQSGEKQGVLCSTGYVSVHAQKKFESTLETACLTFNSKFAVYYLLLSSGSFASYIPKINVEDLLSVPLPDKCENQISAIKTNSDIDLYIQKAFSFKSSEWALIEDLFNYTLPDFKGDNLSPGRNQTIQKQSKSNSDPILTKYCEYFIKVMKAGFGQDKQICATIFQQDESYNLPVRLVAIYLDKVAPEEIIIEPITSIKLLETLNNLNNSFIPQNKQIGIFYQRTARIYSSTKIKNRDIPTIYLLKPDKIRYWTRSMALHDADNVASDIMLSKKDR